MDRIERVNQELKDTLDQLLVIPIEDERSDQLVQQVQQLVTSRQQLLAQLIQVETDANILQAQVDIGRELEEKAKDVREYRKNLIVSSNNKQRQLKIYNSVDANR
ncbi:hypothetical protein L9G74_08450 [Shewanella sp. C32]|uniref:Flagella biosynthesis chaperone for FliD, FliT n=1 Tax=Shewanella electrica TaxID=515560 RepID=A0ABT2FJF8_9GAMM|nr:hypothetical protein [Shewanella electrica]MCH1924564.1 hypothetical protein [Shewanella electrica]MCS4556465.1 hypothetical protein [Shewanella electrica]